jgi:hypothetical protein
MEPIKVSVDVNLHLSEKTEQFILGLFSSKPAPQAPANKPESKPAPQAPANKSESKPAPQAPANKPESKPAPQAPANSSISIEDVREALKTKIATHRSEIKEKLTELGAPSVTKLEEAKYQDMLDFLNSLD